MTKSKKILVHYNSELSNTWYSINFSACSLSSSLDSLKNLRSRNQQLRIQNHLAKEEIQNLERVSVKLLGETLESNVVSIEIGKHGMINVGNIVFHTGSVKIITDLTL